MGFGRACAPVRCAHPSFWAHCNTNRDAARPPPHRSFAASYSAPKLNKIYRTRAAQVMGFTFFVFFLFLYSFWSFLFVILFLFFSPFLITSYSSIFILLNSSYSSYSSRTILRLLIFRFLYFNLFVVLQTHECTGATIRPYFCVLSFFIVFWTFVFVILFLFFSLHKTPRKIQFGKKSAKVYHSLYSSAEQRQVTLWTYMFLKLGLNNEKSIHTLPLRSVPFLSLHL